jgi:hypothetical protein
MQVIEITRDNVNEIAKGLAASVNKLGFRKNGKEMVASQALRVLAERKGLNEHTFMRELEKPQRAGGNAQALTLLGGLVRYLTRSYGDDQWDCSTREFFEEAATLLGWEPFAWQLDDEETDAQVPAHSAETAKAITLGKLGYTFAPDVGQPSSWVWTHDTDSCGKSFTSLDEALDDVWSCVATDVMVTRKLTGSAWEALGLAKQLSLVEEVLLPAEPVTSDPVRQKTPMEEAIEALQAKWGSEHGWYGRDEWREDVAQGSTKLGYWEWVQHAIEGNGDEEEHCSECGKPLDDDGYDGKCGDCADKDDSMTEQQDEARYLGIDLSDVIFWVKQYFNQEFRDATAAQRGDWMHHYRQCNGLAPDFSAANRSAADAAFEAYDFGEDVTVAAHNGWYWTTGDSVMTKDVFLEDNDKPEAPSRHVRFVVNVVAGRVTDISVQ